MSGAINKHQKDNSASALVEVCSVRVGETLFGVPISHILEIVGRTRPEPVPLAPAVITRSRPIESHGRPVSADAWVVIDAHCMMFRSEVVPVAPNRIRNVTVTDTK